MTTEPTSAAAETFEMDDDEPADERLHGVDIDAPIGFVPVELSVGVLAPEVP